MQAARSELFLKQAITGVFHLFIHWLFFPNHVQVLYSAASAYPYNTDQTNSPHLQLIIFNQRLNLYKIFASHAKKFPLKYLGYTAFISAYK